MSKTKNTLCIAEWQSFDRNDIKDCLSDSNKNKANEIFNDLKSFAQQEGNHQFLSFKNDTKLKARNFVGLIQTKSGFCVEILPKTFKNKGKKDDDGFKGQENEQEATKSAKKLLLEMLKTLKNSPFKESEMSALKLQNMPLLEIFIIMFLNELDNLVKRGLKSEYIVADENRKFLKGKLLFNENVKYNFAHRERFFTSSDEFSADNAPNRLIKSTLELFTLQNLSGSVGTRLMQMRFIFADIMPSQNLQKDFITCQMKPFRGYELILKWCEIFLRRRTFTPYNGANKAFALLFDMNKLFESFVAHRLKSPKTQSEKDFIKALGDFSHIKTQEQSKYLAKLRDEENIFQLKPDIVGYNKDEKDKDCVFIADTKWKILNDVKSQNYGISQGDMYQLFAYLAKYQCKNGFIIYPDIKGVLDSKDKIEFTFKAPIFSQFTEKATIHIVFFPLESKSQTQ